MAFFKKAKNLKNERIPEDERKIVIDALETSSGVRNVVAGRTTKQEETNKSAARQVTKETMGQNAGVQKEKVKVDQPTNKRLSVGATRRKDYFWLKTIPFFIIILVLAVFVFCNEGVFRYAFLSEYAKPIARALHFPVGVVGTKLITFNEYESEIQQLTTYMNTTPDFGATLPVLRSTEETAFTRLVEMKTLEYGYESYGISVTSAELDDALFNLIGARRGDLDAQGIIQESFGVSVDSFIDYLLKPYLLKRKLLFAIEKDPNFVQTQRIVAQGIFDSLKNGSKTFDQYLSEAKSSKAYTATDTGYYRTANLPSDFSSVKDLQVGERSEVIEDQNGFHIVSVVETIPSGSSVSDSTYVRLEHIKVPKPDIRWWLAREYQRRSIVIIAPTFLWQPLCEQVVSAGKSCVLEATTDLGGYETAQDALDAALRESQNIHLPQ